MINKKQIILLLLFGSAIFFYYKKSTDILIVICLFIFYILLNDNNEYLENVPPNEALQQISSMYNSGTLTVSNLKVTGNIDIAGGGKIKSDGRLYISSGENLYLLPKGKTIIGKEWGGTGNLDVQGNYDNSGNSIVKGNLDVSGNSKVSGTSNVEGTLTVKGHIIVPTVGNSIVVGNGGFSSNDENVVIYRKNDGQVLMLSNIISSGFATPHGTNGSVGGWNAYSYGVARAV